MVENKKQIHLECYSIIWEISIKILRQKIKKRDGKLCYNMCFYPINPG